MLEIVAGRLLAPYVGMSLYSWTAIIAAVLAGLSAGHWLGGRLAGPAIDAGRAARRVGIALILAAFATLAVLPLLRFLAARLIESVDPLPAILVLAGSLFVAPSLLVGIVSPILTRLAIDAQPGDPGRVLGRMYALGALGSIAGTLAAGFLFISWLGTTRTVLAVAGVYALLGLAFLSEARRLALGAALVLIGAGGWIAADEAKRPACAVESDYYCLRAEDVSRLMGRPATALVIDHLAHSINDRFDPTRLHSPYLGLTDELWRRIGGGRAPAAFFVGGGALTLPRAWAARWPEARLLVAEIDPAVTRFAEERLWFTPSPAITLRHDDARRVLARLPPAPQFDVVLGDAFHDIAVPAHLVTEEFAAEVARRLKPSGFYAVNVIESAEAPVFLLAFAKTLARAFASVEIWLDEESARRGGRVTFLVLAAAAPSPADRVTSTAPPERAWRRWPQGELAPRLADPRVPVLTDDLAPVDRLMAHLFLNKEGERP